MWWQDVTEWTPALYRQLDLEVAQTLNWHIKTQPIEVGGQYYILYTPSGERVSGSLRSPEHALELAIAARTTPSFSQDMNITLPLMCQLPPEDSKKVFDDYLTSGNVHLFALAWLTWVHGDR